VSATRAASNPIGLGTGRSNLVGERQVSSSSIGAGGSGRYTTPIDEEQGDFVFNMEGMEDLDEKKGEKRNSGGAGGWGYPVGTRSSNPGAGGGGRNGTGSTTNGGTEGMFGR